MYNDFIRLQNHDCMFSNTIYQFKVENNCVEIISEDCLIDSIIDDLDGLSEEIINSTHSFWNNFDDVCYRKHPVLEDAFIFHYPYSYMPTILKCSKCHIIDMDKIFKDDGMCKALSYIIKEGIPYCDDGDYYSPKISKIDISTYDECDKLIITVTVNKDAKDDKDSTVE